MLRRRPRRPDAEGADKTPAIRTEEDRLKEEEQMAPVKAVEDAEEAAEAARQAEEEQAEKPAVIRAEEARLKAEADERVAAEEAGAVTREAQNSAAKSKAA